MILKDKKLFDEIFYLELNEIIHNTLNSFYEKKAIHLLKKLLFFMYKTVNDEQIEQMAEDLLLKVEYHPVNVDEEIFELSKDKHLKKFYKTKKKKKKKFYKFIYFSFCNFVDF